MRTLCLARVSVLLAVLFFVACGDDGGAEDGGALDGSEALDGSAACRSAADCDDGLFCNGEESCDPESAEADARGCIGAAEPCGADERCDDDEDACLPVCPVALDFDGDGRISEECGGDDCDDRDPNRFPGNTEVCDAAGHDEDCNPETFGFVDEDGDGVGSAACCNGIVCGPDCDDANAAIKPGEVDGPPLTCDGLDNDCDGTPDVGCPCVESETRPCGIPAQLDRIGLCQPGGQVCVGGAWTDMCLGGVRPSAEACDGLDNDCDGAIDEAVRITYYRDGDADGYGIPGETVAACSPPAGYAANPDDCDDTRAGVSPAAVEVCNGRDEDCDTHTDEGVLRTFYRDADGDSFGVVGTTGEACIVPAGYTDRAGDCDDMRAGVNPSALETCDGRDNDCDMSVDPGCSCTDGTTRACGSSSVGICSMGTQRCIGGVWAECVGGVEPRLDVCNGLDDDCDASTDEGTTALCYVDGDGDGRGTGVQLAVCRGSGAGCPAGYTAMSGDCNDGNAAVRPGATEACNSIDDDCDGTVDEGTTRGCYFDGDRDGVGAGPQLTVCAAAGGGCPTGYSTTGNDCNDSVASIHPRATEVCNGGDDDCDMAPDDGFACVQNTISYCVTACGTSGQRTCDASCAWREAQCEAPAESCNYCDDDGSGSFYDERPLALSTYTASGDCETASTVTAPAACQSYSIGSPVPIVYRTARVASATTSTAGAVWLNQTARMGYGTMIAEAMVRVTDLSTDIPAYGWALVIATDTGAAVDTASPATTLGVPNTRTGLAVEWRFYGDSLADPMDRITARRLGFIDISLIERAPPMAAHLDNDSATKFQRIQVEYTPDDPSAGVAERLVIRAWDDAAAGWHTVIDSGGAFGGFTPNLALNPGATLRLGVVGYTPASASSSYSGQIDVVMQSGPGLVRPSTFMSTTSACAM